MSDTRRSLTGSRASLIVLDDYQELEPKASDTSERLSINSIGFLPFKEVSLFEVLGWNSATTPEGAGANRTLCGSAVKAALASFTK